jgi:antitoxin ParD1/3/4
MGIRLTADVETIVRQKVESGLYPSADEVLREALRLLDEHDRLRWRRAALAEGEEGEGVEYTPELMERIRANAIRRWKAGEKPSPDVLP